MTNETINVPRELLADLLGNDHDKRIMAERHLLAMLANTPSPAGVVMPAELDRAFITGESCDGVYRVAIQSETLKEMQAVHSWLTSLNAAPAAPAADAGIVDMYRHLQKVTPYRFKKIQDASITDGGDVMYFHKDRFDAALLADMAAHRAKGWCDE